MSRVALGLAYDGSAWQGWQTQPHRQTVQDTLEAALARFCGVADPVATVCAGRTDTGVHGAMQVIHLDTVLDRRMESWVRGVNAFLPPSISVHWAQAVPDDFHARFSARARTYVYLLWRGRVRPALWAGRAGWCHQPLDVAAMRAAAGALLGEHDFSSFRSSQCQARHPVRIMHRLDIEERGPFLVFTLRANAFLHHMVRNIMGALLQIGQGREPLDWMAQLLSWRDRKRGAPTFSPDGLYLSAIDYPDEFGLDQLDGGALLLSPFTQPPGNPS
ncbi:tRNA pseudouridine(38-40) synthase TruA [Achromobacter ruhlandii]|uniref:tRNA pseudouridine(38-40) synthase TruA n=1 Tax=Achromobacter ruhlandii TaxID=72557 RepID=UPI003B9D8CBE